MQKKSTLRQVRVFSEPLRKRAVTDIESGKKSVHEVCREYMVSTTTVYRWLNKYSRHLHSNKRLVVEMQSEGHKTKELERRIRELEAALGRKQMELDYLNKMIEIGSAEVGVDLKKKFDTPPFTGSGSTKDSTDTK